MSSARCSPAFPWVLKGLRLAAEEVPEGCDFRGGRRPLPLLEPMRPPRSASRGERGRAGMRSGFRSCPPEDSCGPPGSMHDAAAPGVPGLLEGIDPSGWIASKGYVRRGMVTPHKNLPNGELSEDVEKAYRSVNRIRQVVEQTITAALSLYVFKTIP